MDRARMTEAQRTYRDEDAIAAKVLIALASVGIVGTLILVFVLGKGPAPAEPLKPSAAVSTALQAAAGMTAPRRVLPVEARLDKVVVWGERKRIAATSAATTSSSAAVLAR